MCIPARAINEQVSQVLRNRDHKFSAQHAHTILLLDDFGGEDDASWKAPELEMVVRSRQRDRLPTIITANYAPESVKWPWFVSLLKRHYIQIQVNGINWRASV